MNEGKRLYISDLDGTLLNGDKEITGYTRNILYDIGSNREDGVARFIAAREELSAVSGNIAIHDQQKSF